MKGKSTDVRIRTETHILSAKKDLKQEQESTKLYMPVLVIV